VGQMDSKYSAFEKGMIKLIKLFTTRSNELTFKKKGVNLLNAWTCNN